MKHNSQQISRRSCLRGAGTLAALTLAPSLAFGAAPGLQTIAGAGAPENNGDAGPADAINIGDTFGVEIGPDGALYITEVRNHRVWRLDLKTNRLIVVAGNGKKGYDGDGGPATKASLNEPYEVRFDASGNMFFVEMQNHLIRRVDAKTKVITTVAGCGERGFAGDGGSALTARFHRPHSIALDNRNGLYVADIGNHRIRRVDLVKGTVQTIAGDGGKTLPEDGQIATGGSLLGPRALYFRDSALWIALREGHSIWKLNLADGRLRHVAGSGRKGHAGDGGPPKSATFNGPKGIALGPGGDIFVADTENHAIRRIDSSESRIDTIAGGGSPQQAGLNRPHGVCVGPDGSVYIGDTLNHCVKMVRT